VLARFPQLEQRPENLVGEIVLLGLIFFFDSIAFWLAFRLGHCHLGRRPSSPNAWKEGRDRSE
jgi:hypothetical protein